MCVKVCVRSRSHVSVLHTKDALCSFGAEIGIKTVPKKHSLIVIYGYAIAPQGGYGWTETGQSDNNSVPC